MWRITTLNLDHFFLTPVGLWICLPSHYIERKSWYETNTSLILTLTFQVRHHVLPYEDLLNWLEFHTKALAEVEMIYRHKFTNKDLNWKLHQNILTGKTQNIWNSNNVEKKSLTSTTSTVTITNGNTAIMWFMSSSKSQGNAISLEWLKETFLSWSCSDPFTLSCFLFIVLLLLSHCLIVLIPSALWTGLCSLLSFIDLSMYLYYLL